MGTRQGERNSVTGSYAVVRGPFGKLYRGQQELLARVFDACCVAGAMAVAARMYPQPWEIRHSLACALATLLLYLVGEAFGLYRSDRGVPLPDELLKVWKSWSVVALLLTLVAFVTKTSEIHSRFVTLVWFAMTPLAICGRRMLSHFALREARARGHNTRRAAVAGVHTTGLRIASSIENSPGMGIRFAGFFDDRNEKRLSKLHPELSELTGDFKTLVTLARERKIDLVYIALPPRAEPRINQLIRALGDTTASVYVAYDFGEIHAAHTYWTSLSGVPILSVVDSPFDGIAGWTKRLEDILLGLCMLAIAAIPMSIIAIAVKLTSPGPVLFRQRRYGLNGEPIHVLKFRTMTVCEDGDDVVQATKNDSRVTPIGAFLRRNSLDELPQLLQVVGGSMSIVGPRPHAVAHNEKYRQIIPDYMRRHKVKPGITGWAQVNGWRGETDTIDKMKHRVQHDLDYIRHWGLGLDLKIILMTVLVTAMKKNAY